MNIGEEISKSFRWRISPEIDVHDAKITSLSDGAVGSTTTGGSSTFVVGGNLGLLRGDGVSDWEEGVH